jgi:glycosyltransferase involved in cell wall biosynthesis
MPRVSVLLPAYNARASLYGAIATIQRQTYQDWELVVCDDGSADGTAELAERLAAEDARIRLVCTEHRGIVGALDAAINASSGEIIARMDADDLAHPSRLQRQVQMLDEHPDLWLVGSLVRCFPRKALPEGMARYQEWLNSVVTPEEIERDFFVESPFAHPSVAMWRWALERSGGYQQVPWAEDYDLWMRMRLAGARFAKVPHVLLYWRDHPLRLSRTQREYSMKAFRALKIHYLRKGFLKDVQHVQVWSAGHSGRNWARDLRSAGFRVTRFIDIDPAKIGTVVLGAPVISVEDLLQHRGDPLLVCIGVRGVRALTRARLAAMGWVEGRDYLCVA